MDAALGPPDQMADVEDDLTPMMSQYFELTRRYEDALVLFQVGDFYEVFCEAAEATARICEIALTAREDSTGRYAMAGVPVDNAESYIDDLLDAGYRVAVADQVEDPDEVTGVVERAVTRVVTPGTLTEDELLGGDDNNFVAALAADRVAQRAADGDGGTVDSDGGTVDSDGGTAGDASEAGGEMSETGGGASGGTSDASEAADDASRATDDTNRATDDASVTADDAKQATSSTSQDASGTNDRAGGFGLALLDVSTGDFYATSLGDAAHVRDELGRFAPAELVTGPGVATDRFEDEVFVAAYDDDVFDHETAREKVASYFGSADALAVDAEVRACGALLDYAEYTRGGVAARRDGQPADSAHGSAQDASDAGEDANNAGEDANNAGEDANNAGEDAGDANENAARLDYLNHLTRYDPREYLQLDAVAMQSLELFEQRSVHGATGTALVDVVDETACALGRRTLTDWLRRPLTDEAEIVPRHDAVGELLDDPLTREEVHDHLRDVYDLERLISRVSRGQADARDLRALKDTLDVVPEIRGLLADADCEKLRALRASLDDLPEVRDLLDRAIVSDPPQELTEGGVIRDGYDNALDDLRETERSGKQWIDDLETTERERTGVDSLQVGHNSVHGYYIEVTDPNLDAVPEDYQRRQTLKNAERYVTPELKAREDDIVRAEQRARDLEYELFCEVRNRVAGEAERVQSTASAVAALDALASFAAVAAAHDYARPEMGGDGIHVEGGRHPVVERTEAGFVPNDTSLTPDERFAVVTGPNMSGKSTYMRQVALIALLAQAGSFVPAAAANLRVVDRIFTRVGASDDIAGGRSTFMVEMTELAEILRAATEDSLVLLDEVGRGTSTTDGLAIARAVTEYVHDEVGATTLFATHHHELTADAARLPHAMNLHFGATRTADGVTFKHEVQHGPATASYGVEVARTAGVPETVVDRASEFLAQSSTAGSTDSSTADDPDDRTSEPAAPHGDLAAALRDLNVAELTPVEALNVLHDLKRDLD